MCVNRIKKLVNFAHSCEEKYVFPLVTRQQTSICKKQLLLLWFLINRSSLREISEKVSFNHGNFIHLLILLPMYLPVCVHNLTEASLEALMISWRLSTKSKLTIGSRWALNEVTSGGGFVSIPPALPGFWLFLLFPKESFLGSGAAIFWSPLLIQYHDIFQSCEVKTTPKCIDTSYWICL